MKHNWKTSTNTCNNCGVPQEAQLLGIASAECPGKIPKVLQDWKIHHNEVKWPLIFRLYKRLKGQSYRRRGNDSLAP